MHCIVNSAQLAMKVSENCFITEHTIRITHTGVCSEVVKSGNLAPVLPELPISVNVRPWRDHGVSCSSFPVSWPRTAHYSNLESWTMGDGFPATSVSQLQEKPWMVS